MPFTNCKPGKWYVVITCGSCGIRQPLHPDPSEGKGEVKSEIVRCTICRRNSFYEATAFERYQHTAAGGDNTGDTLSPAMPS